VTTLLRDTQADEFAAVFRFTVDAHRRSDIFTSQTVTTFLWSTVRELDTPRNEQLINHAQAQRKTVAFERDGASTGGGTEMDAFFMPHDIRPLLEQSGSTFDDNVMPEFYTFNWDSFVG